jgi:ketosteroid isomerase-like protein
MQKFFEGWRKIADIKQSIPEIEGNGDLASVRGTYDMTMISPGAKAPVKGTGKSLAIWQKQPDGSWRVRRVMWNSDLPPAR